MKKNWNYPYMGNGYDTWKLSSPYETPCDSCSFLGKCKRDPKKCWEDLKRKKRMG